ncbi:MAG: hypothetical protein QNJ47_12005 [Nostocaceae cyanobacterium]|nr:hypothetical protein [Nostocaceae cyanobacterium]
MSNMNAKIVIRDLDTSYLQELSKFDIENTLGGESIFYYVGYGIGYAARKVYDFFAE